MNAIQSSKTLVTLAYIAMGVMGLMFIASLIILSIIIKHRHGIYAVWCMIVAEESKYNRIRKN